jgi:hypothetical protein
MAELKQDPTHQKQRVERERIRAEGAAEVSRVTEPIIHALCDAGFAVGELEELVPRYAPLPDAAVSVLLHWLPKVHEERVQEMLARALAATTQPFDGGPLAAAFETTDSEALRWVIGNTLALTEPRGIGDWLLRKLADPRSGKARETLAIAAAKHAPREAANQILADLLEDFPGHVAQAFAISGGVTELGLLKSRLQRSKSWDRSEIQKALRAIEKRQGR